MLIAKFKRMAYVAPFYARAAMELMVEDVERKLEAAKKEATRRYEDAPRYFGAELQAAQAEASARAQLGPRRRARCAGEAEGEVVATVDAPPSSRRRPWTTPLPKPRLRLRTAVANELGITTREMGWPEGGACTLLLR